MQNKKGQCHLTRQLELAGVYVTVCRSIGDIEAYAAAACADQEILVRRRVSKPLTARGISRHSKTFFLFQKFFLQRGGHCIWYIFRLDHAAWGRPQGSWLGKESPTPLLIATKPVQHVSEYKFLGVTVNSRVKWDDHIAAITSKAAKQLWFLKKLKRAGVSREDLVYFYQAVVRPVLEYACSAWHTSITKDQTKSLEDIQRRAVQVIVGNIPYEEACCMLNLSPLSHTITIVCI